MSEVEFEPDIQEQLIDELVKRELARTSLVQCAQYIMHDYHIAWFHQQISNAIDRMFLPKEDPYALRRLLITMPPRSGKSYLLSEILPAFLLGRNPNWRIISCSYGAKLAMKFCKSVQRIIGLPAYRSLFPETRLSEQTSGRRAKLTDSYTRTADFFEVVGAKGYYRAAGVGGPITGTGFDWGIIDDPVKNEVEADSPTIQERNLNWYRSVFRTRAEADARIILIGTLWHPEDLITTLMRQGDVDLAADKFHVLKFPAKACGNLAPYDPRAEGEYLWPWKYSEAEYAAMEASMGVRAWEALYQCNPTAEGSSEWDKSFFDDEHFFIADNQFPKHERQSNVITMSPIEEIQAGVLAVDPSKGIESKKGDYSFITYCGRTNAKRIVGDAWSGKVSAEILVDQMIEMAIRYKPQWVVGEENAFQNLILEAFKKKAETLGLPCKVFGVTHNTKKEVRIRRLGPFLSKHAFKFKRNIHTILLRDQLRLFPNAVHDDGPDSLELCIRHLVLLVNSRIRRDPTILRI